MQLAQERGKTPRSRPDTHPTAPNWSALGTLEGPGIASQVTGNEVTVFAPPTAWEFGITEHIAVAADVS